MGNEKLNEGIAELQNNQEINGIDYWRERILMTILTVGLVAGLFVLILMIFMAMQTGAWLVAILDAAAYGITLMVLLRKQIRYVIRAGCALFLALTIGVYITAYFGLISGGPVCLFAFAVLAGLLLGRQAAIAALSINGLILLTFGYLSFAGYWGQSMPFFPSLLRGLVSWATFMMMNAVTALSVAVLVGSLRDLAAKEHSSNQRLLEERHKLTQEIEGRAKAEAALRENEQRYRLLAENVSDVIWTLALDTMRFVYISPSVLRMRGITPEQAMAQDLSDVLSPESLEAAYNILAEELAMDGAAGVDPLRSRTIEFKQQIQGGNYAWAEATITFMRDAEGKPVGILGVTRDISDRKEADEKRKTLEAKLQQSQKMESLGLLAGGVAHDLNNILSGIVSYPELVLMDLPETSKIRKPIETMKASGHRAAAIVEDLLTIARGVATNKEILNINILIMDYLKSPEFHKLIQFHPSVAMHTDLDSDLPSIKGSLSHVRKVIMNLVSNATEAIESGGAVAISTQSCYVDRPLRGYADVKIDEYVVLTVTDDGAGIASNEIERIFEPFFTKKIMGRSGTGLGLAVVWNVMRDHNGYIDVESDENGTTFRLFFPISREKVVENAVSLPIESYMGHGETILIIDDVATQREIASKILERLGYDVEAVSSGEEAVEFVKKRTVDLLLLDMIMEPGISGLETYDRILKIHPGQKAVIVSGFSETDAVKEAQQLGAGQFVKKPYTLEKIGLAIKHELEKPTSRGRTNSTN